MQPTNTTHLTRAGLALRWDTAPGSLANMASVGRGPRLLKIGARVLYRLSDVLDNQDRGIVGTLDQPGTAA